MATPFDLMVGVRAYAVTQGIARLADTAGTLPPIYVDPPDGLAIAPGDKTSEEQKAAGQLAVNDHRDLIITALWAGGLTAPRMESYWIRGTVDFYLRARKAPYAFAKEEELHAAYVGDIGKQDWDMAGLHVISSQEWRGLQRIPNAGGSDASFVVSYLFEFARAP
jgi:hypothetical protein